MTEAVRRPSDVEVTERRSRSVLTRVQGIPFMRWSINPYQGCAHQCVFCYARRTHAYRDLDGERSWGSRLFAKVDAPAVLREDLRRRWDGGAIAMGTATDPYQPIEGRYRITRALLAELAAARAGVHITTRGPLVVRDLDRLVALARVAEVGVAVSIATLDPELAREIEPTVAPPASRLRAVRLLAAAGIRTSVAVAPLMPGINDAPEAIAAVVAAAAEAGAERVWHGALNLGEITREAFLGWLAEARPALLPAYQRLYRGRYAGAALDRAYAARIDAAVRAAPWTPRAPIIPAPPVEQLSLLSGDALPCGT